MSRARQIASLLAASPALSAGLLILGNGGFDFWGNPVFNSSAPNLGAYHSNPVQTKRE